VKNASQSYKKTPKTKNQTTKSNSTSSKKNKTSKIQQKTSLSKINKIVDWNMTVFVDDDDDDEATGLLGDKFKDDELQQHDHLLDHSSHNGSDNELKASASASKPNKETKTKAYAAAQRKFEDCKTQLLLHGMRQHGKNYTDMADYYNKRAQWLLCRPDNLRHKYKKLIATKTGDPHQDPFICIVEDMEENLFVENGTVYFPSKTNNKDDNIESTNDDIVDKDKGSTEDNENKVVDDDNKVAISDKKISSEINEMNGKLAPRLYHGKRSQGNDLLHYIAHTDQVAAKHEE
jgi:hypothetical protein